MVGQPPKVAVVLRGTKNGAIRLDLDNAAEIASRLGEIALVAFSKCFVGIDRVVSLRNLYLLNAKNGAEGSFAKERNAGLLMVLLVGTMHELGNAINRLQGILGRSKKAPPSLEKMMAIRRRWHSDEIGKRIRDQMAHHLGDEEVYRKGFATSLTQPSVCLYSADGPTIGDIAFEAPWNWLMAGLELDRSDTQPLVDQMVRDFADVPEILLSLFQEVVTMAGIPVEDQRVECTNARS